MVLANGYVIDGQHYNTHITGIPYTLNTSSNDGWSTKGKVNWNTDGGVRIGYNSTKDNEYITKSFHIPADVTVKVTANGTHGAMVGQTNTITLTVGGTNVCSQAYKAGWVAGKQDFSCSSASASMSSSANTVKCNSSFNSSYSYVTLKALHIEF